MVLENINYPSDLKNLSYEELDALAREIRDMIIDTTVRTGGHLAASLGAVDFTIALHRVFSAPKDKIVWDVGHQSYAHKILTGRKDAFATLRTFGGLSGFPNRGESEYDIFTVGHSSTSISSALGLAVARDIKGEDYKVIAVIGDGSMTGGLAFEGLQNTGHLGTDLLVILNDNEMFISHKVGAFAGYLAKLLTAARFKRFEDRVEKFFKRLHFWGTQILRVAKRFKVLLFPGMLFEELGFAYLGPVDGHNIRRLVEILENVKNMKGPILLHVVTKKGKGYPPAENDPTKFHGISPFLPNKMKAPALTYTQVFSDAIVQLSNENQKIVAITAAMTDGTGLAKFAKEFPERFFDVGIAEQHAVTFAAGLAAAGLHPVCAIYSTFLQRSFDQLVHDVALNNLPVIFAIDRAGLVGEDGATHQGAFDLSYVRMIPNFIVCSPKNGNELRDMLYSAFRWRKPVAIRYPRGSSGLAETRKDFRYIDVGLSETVLDGNDVFILSIGSCFNAAIEAADILKKSGISAGVVNMRFVKPLDEKTLLGIVSKTDRIVTVEENTIIGGMGSAVNEYINKIGKTARVLNIGLPDVFIEHGNHEELRKKYRLDADSLAQSIIDWMR